MTKKTLILTSILLIFALTSAYAQSKFRYIIFFAQTANIPQPVINKILNSNYFVLTIPIDASENLPTNIEELIASGKGEISMSLKPEPLLPMASSIYGPSGYSPDRQDIFTDYFKISIDEFKSKTNADRFGLFLKSGEISNEFMFLFGQNKFVWVNSLNTPGNMHGAYKINGMNTFALYKNFPTNSNDVMKWLSSTNESVIPVLLTDKHLSNAALMSYLVELFDKSLYIKPASPLYLNDKEKEKFSLRNNVVFSKTKISPSIMEKLASAADVIRKYRNMSGYSQVSYKNAQSEFLMLNDYQLLSGVESKSVESKRTFDAIYDNIFKLLGAAMFSDSEMEKMSVSVNTGEENQIIADIWQIDGGISVANSDLIRNLSVISSENSIKVSLKFDTEDWNGDISFVDIYIDMNNIEGLGSTVMLKGIKGFLDSNNGWEYAVRMYKDRALLYRDSPDGSVLLGEFPVRNNSVNINRFIRGNPRNWSVQAVAVNSSSGDNEVIDFLGKSNRRAKKDILTSAPLEIPAIRIKK
ncbi:MAG: hypothetical protein LBT79_00720 [Elusimicrobiota bacterium]|jgi:hypothetical protein|nr:hypothetical protein [Elusimicrobiota bacterium]